MKTTMIVIRPDDPGVHVEHQVVGSKSGECDYGQFWDEHWYQSIITANQTNGQHGDIVVLTNAGGVGVYQYRSPDAERTLNPLTTINYRTGEVLYERLADVLDSSTD